MDFEFLLAKIRAMTGNDYEAANRATIGDHINQRMDSLMNNQSRLIRNLLDEQKADSEISKVLMEDGLPSTQEKS